MMLSCEHRGRLKQLQIISHDARHSRRRRYVRLLQLVTTQRSRVFQLNLRRTGYGDKYMDSLTPVTGKQCAV